MGSFSGLVVTSTSPLSSIGCWRYNNVMPPRPWHGPNSGGMTQADFYILLVLAAFLLSLPAAVFIFYWIPRTKKEKKEKAKKKMVVVDQQRPLETVLTLESALPSYEEATKSRRADNRLDCNHFAAEDILPQLVPAIVGKKWDHRIL